MKKGILFTNKKLDGQILFMSKYNLEDRANGYFVLGVYEVSNCACIGELLDEEGLPIDISNINLKTKSFSAFDDKIAMVDNKYLNYTNCLAESNCCYDMDNKKGLYLESLKVNKNYRDLGLAKSMMEVIKTFSHINKFKSIYGTAAPLDILKNKKVAYKPARNVEYSIFHPNCLFSELVEPDEDYCENETSKESYSCLKYIYERLGFEVESASTNLFGSITYNVSKYRATSNYDNLFNLLSVEPDKEFDFDSLFNDSSDAESDYFERVD